MTELFEHGARKFARADLMLTSQSRNWRGVGAELRRHPAGELTPILPAQMEITLAVNGSPTSLVERRAGSRQRTPARSGTLWFCPIGVREDEIRISDPIPEVLHVYLPRERFTELDETDGFAGCDPGEVFYLADVDDPLVREIARRILQELASETAGGALLVQSLAQTLALHIGLTYSPRGGRALPPVRSGLDQARLTRVLDYIESHLESDIQIGELARIACLSRYHFSRSFHKSLGVAPHHYIGNLRLERAKALLATGDMPVSQIAMLCQFSSQSAFGRAFLRSTGESPAQYRRQHRSPRTYSDPRSPTVRHD